MAHRLSPMGSLRIRHQRRYRDFHRSVSRFRFFHGIQDEKSPQARQHNTHVEFPIGSALPAETKVTLGWMPHQTHECVDDRGQGEDQRTDKDSGTFELKGGENHTEGAQRPGNSGQSGKRSTRHRELGNAPPHPKYPQGKKNRYEEISDADAQEAGVGILQFPSALSDQRNIYSPTHPRQQDKPKPDFGIGIHQKSSSGEKSHSRRKAATKGARSVAATAAVSANSPTVNTA